MDTVEKDWVPVEKKLPINLKKHKTSFWLTIEEKEKVKHYIEEMRFNYGKR